jgi:hypothetical protein
MLFCPWQNSQKNSSYKEKGGRNDLPPNSLLRNDLRALRLQSGHESSIVHQVAAIVNSGKAISSGFASLFVSASAFKYDEVACAQLIQHRLIYIN